MKKFIVRVFIFFSIVILIMLCNFAFNTYFRNTCHFKTKAKTIIIGDSRMMTGIDPKRIKNCINTAQNSESYFISFYKLKYILKYNKEIENLIIGFSYPSFSDYMDKIYKNDLATADVLNRIYPIIPLADFGNLQVDKQKYFTIIFRNMFILPNLNHEKFIGGYSPLPSGISNANVNSTINRHYFDSDKKQCGVSKMNRSYLDSIINLSKKNNIALYLVNLPLHKEYFKKIPVDFIRFYEKTKEEMLNGKITVFDYADEDFDDLNFKDHVHLSSKGAEIMSRRINQVLR